MACLRLSKRVKMSPMFQGLILPRQGSHAHTRNHDQNDLNLMLEKELPQNKEKFPRSHTNNDEAKKLYSFNRFLNNYFINQTCYNYNYKNKLSSYTGRLNSTLFKLESINQTFKNEYIKNSLLSRVTMNFLINNKSTEQKDSVLNLFSNLSSNQLAKGRLTKLFNAVSKLSPDNTIPDQGLINLEQKSIQLSSLFKKPITALYFWSLDYTDHYTKAHDKASLLSEKYPEIDFLAINIDNTAIENWSKTVKLNNYNFDQEFRFKNPKRSFEDLVFYYRRRVV